MASPEDQCSKVLAEIHSSNLHYLVQESPFSLYVTIRKKFIKNAPEKSQHSLTSASPPIEVQQRGYRVNMLENQKSDLENQLKTKDLELNESKDTIKLLEDKLERAESELFKESNKTVSEIKLLKKSIKNSKEESKNHKKTFSEVNRMMKLKEETNFILQKNLENIQDKNEMLIDANAKLKVDKERSQKKNKKVSDAPRAKSKGTQTDLETCNNVSSLLPSNKSAQLPSNISNHSSSQLPMTQDKLLVSTKPLTLPSFASLPLTNISCPLSMCQTSLTKSNMATDSSTSPAFQLNPSPLNLALPDCMNNFISSPFVPLDTSPVLDTITSNMDMLQSLNKPQASSNTSSRTTTTRSRSPHTPPGTPPPSASTEQPLCTSEYFPQSPPGQDTRKFSTVSLSDIKLLRRVYLGPRKTMRTTAEE